MRIYKKIIDFIRINILIFENNIFYNLLRYFNFIATCENMYLD